jgi:hypothetical protein
MSQHYHSPHTPIRSSPITQRTVTMNEVPLSSSQHHHHRGSSFHHLETTPSSPKSPDDKLRKASSSSRITAKFSQPPVFQQEYQERQQSFRRNNEEAPLFVTRNGGNVDSFISDTIHSNSSLKNPSNKYIKAQKQQREDTLKFARKQIEQSASDIEYEDHQNVSVNSGKSPYANGQASDDDLDDYETASDISISTVNSDHIARNVDLYKKLPPPNIQMIPFNLFREPVESDIITQGPRGKDKSYSGISVANVDQDSDLGFDIATREDFERLKAKTIKYIDNLHGMLDNMFGKNPNDYVVYYSHLNDKTAADEKQAEEQDSSDEQPTTIQYLKALEKASDIIEEVDRSRKEIKLRKKMGLYKPQAQNKQYAFIRPPKPMGFTTSPISPNSKMARYTSPSKDGTAILVKTIQSPLSPTSTSKRL